MCNAKKKKKIIYKFFVIYNIIGIVRFLQARKKKKNSDVFGFRDVDRSTGRGGRLGGSTVGCVVSVPAVRLRRYGAAERVAARDGRRRVRTTPPRPLPAAVVLAVQPRAQATAAVPVAAVPGAVPARRPLVAARAPYVRQGKASTAAAAAAAVRPRYVEGLTADDGRQRGRRRGEATVGQRGRSGHGRHRFGARNSEN